MSDRSRAGTVAVVVIGLILASSASGLAYALLTSDDYEAGLQREREREEAVARDWCDNVTPYVGRSRPVRSFAQLAEDALAGELRTPHDMPDPDATTELDRWQEEHPAYTTSVYLSSLEGFPRELTIAEAGLKAAFDDAHAGRTSNITPWSTREVAEALDEFVAEHC